MLEAESQIHLWDCWASPSEGPDFPQVTASIWRHLQVDRVDLLEAQFEVQSSGGHVPTQCSGLNQSHVEYGHQKRVDDSPEDDAHHALASIFVHQKD